MSVLVKSVSLICSDIGNLVSVGIGGGSESHFN